jgi:hypothetical protein
MASPLSGALKGVKYDGTNGNMWSDLGDLLGGFVQDARVQAEQKRKDALDAAMAAMKQAEFERQGKQIDYQMNRDRIGDQFKSADDNRAERQLQASMEQNQLSRDALQSEREQRRQEREQNEAALEAYRNRTGDQRDRQLGQGDTRIAQQAQKGSFWEDDQHNVWYKPNLGNGAAVQMERNPSTGEMRPVRQVAGQAPAQPSGNLRPIAYTGDSQAQSPQGQAPSPQAPGSGWEAVQGKSAIPTQGEREAKSAYDTLEPLFGNVIKSMGDVGFTPPSVGTQLAVDASRQPRESFKGSLVATLGNEALGKYHPDYQKYYVATNALSTFLTKMITGAQMSAPEAERIKNLIEWKAGDNPATVKDRIAQAAQIISAARERAGRAQTYGQSQPTPQGPDNAAVAEPDNPRQYWDYQRRNGKTPEEATQMTLQKFPNAKMRK